MFWGGRSARRSQYLPARTNEQGEQTFILRTKETRVYDEGETNVDQGVRGTSPIPTSAPRLPRLHLHPSVLQQLLVNGRDLDASSEIIYWQFDVIFIVLTDMVGGLSFTCAPG